MKLFFKILLSTFLYLSPLVSEHLIQETNIHKEELLNKISDLIHPNMAKIWKMFFLNFDQDNITAWQFSERSGHFTLILKTPLKLWIPASKAGSEPRPGSILIFGSNNKVEGRLNSYKKSIEFDRGFHIYCKYKIGFVTVPIMVDVYNFTYKNDDVIILEAGKGGISEKRGKPLEKYLNAWFNPAHVVLGDYEAFLNCKAKGY